MHILKITDLNSSSIHTILAKPKLTHPEFIHIYSLIPLTTLTQTSYPLLTKLLLSPYPQIYCYELKKFLSDTNKSLYEKYSACFYNNPGCNEAFNIKSKNRVPYLKIEKLSQIKMLDPVFNVRKKKSRDNEKKKIRRNTNIKAGEKNRALIEEGKEYRKKLKKMYAKIESNK